MARKLVSTRAGPGPGPARSSPAAAAAARVRSRTGSKSIRGHISSPIPIPSLLDKELCMSLYATGFPMPVDPLTNSVDPATEACPLDNTRQDVVLPAASPDSVEDIISHGSTEQDPDVSSTMPRTESAARSFPVQITSPCVEFQDSSTRANTPQRPKSGFRVTLTKLFSRRKSTLGKVATRSSPFHEIEEEKSGQHRSELTGSNHPLPSPDTDRSASLPITEYGRALRSHSISPDDVLAIQSVRNSINTERHLAIRRSATTNTRPASSRWTKPRGLAPRPASTHDWSRLVDASHDPEDIGRAVTTGLKRRPRSLSFNPRVETASNTVAKHCRGDEAPYCRESHDKEPTSSISSSPPECEEVGILAPQESEPETNKMPELSLKPTNPSIAEIAGMNMTITDATTLERRISSIESRLAQVEDLTQQPTIYRQGSSTTERPATVREVTSLPNLHKSLTGPLTMDHFATLMACIETDRSARLALEAQVKNLSHQINLLTKSRSLAGTVGANAPLTGRSFGKRRRSSDALNDSGIATDDGDDDEDYAESFATPYEDRHSLDGLRY